jgi:hypothetical protein
LSAGTTAADLLSNVTVTSSIGDGDTDNILGAIQRIPTATLSLSGVALWILGLGVGVAKAEVAQATQGLYSAEGKNKAMTQALARIEKHLDRMQRKDLEAAHLFLRSGIAHLRDADTIRRGVGGDGAQAVGRICIHLNKAEEDFTDARRLAMEGFSQLNAMDKVACTDLWISSSYFRAVTSSLKEGEGGVSADEMTAFRTDANMALKTLIHDDSEKNVRKELNPSWWSSTKLNHALLRRLRELVDTTRARVLGHRLMPWEPLSDGWETDLQVTRPGGGTEKELITNLIVDRVGRTPAFTLRGHSNSVRCV